jgi:hypothetical protein
MPEILHALVRGHVGFREQNGVAPAPLQELPHLVQHLVILRRRDVRPLRLDQKRHGIHPEAGDAQLEPEPHDAHDFLAHRGIRRVQIRLEFVEAVEVVLAGGRIQRPRRFLHARKHHALVPVLRAGLRPDVPVPVRRVRAAARGLEPRVALRRVAHDEIHDHPHAELLRVVHELDVLTQGAVLRVHTVVIGHVVAVVLVRRRIERLQPHTRHAEAGQIVEAPREPRKISDAIAVRVEILLDVEAVDDRVLVPEVVHHRGLQLDHSVAPPQWFSS